jgi:type IV pilus assembly protein PilA
MSFLTFLLIIIALSTTIDTQSILQRQENSIGQPKSESSSLLLRGCGCLVLLMCIGVMSAIALPSFLSMATKAKQSEAKQYISSMNKGQQAHFAEKSAFATSIAALGIGIQTETIAYKYSILATKTAAFSYAVAKGNTIKNYFGGVFLVPAKELDPNAARDEMTTISILCEEAEDKNHFFRFKPADEAAEPIYQNGKVICGKGTTELTR